MFYHFQGVPEMPLFKTSYTYFNVTESPLIPGFIKGAVAKVTRGWGQVIALDASKYSVDPDMPLDNNFDYTWWCRRVDSDPPEQFPEIVMIDTDFDGLEEPVRLVDI